MEVSVYSDHSEEVELKSHGEITYCKAGMVTGSIALKIALNSWIILT